ncbi:MAG: hypothetical protein ABR549_05700 [Mycobacteriales bacterium]
MSPIDDELRSVLQSRAAAVAPAPDPLGGIESRARGLRRRRVIASVSAAASVVAAAAVAVPLLTHDHDTVVRPPVTTSSAGALDFDHPWAMRGSLPSAEVSSLKDSWQLQQPGSTLSVLFGQRYAGHDEAWFVTSDRRSGHATFLTAQQTSIQAAPWTGDGRSVVFTSASDDGRGRLVVIAAPDATVEYAANGRSYQPISDVGQAPKGIGLVPIEGDDPDDTLRITEADGTTFTQDAPNWTPPPGSPPSNLVRWVHRGDAADQPPTGEVLHAFTQATGHSDDDKAHYVSLYDGAVQGVRYTIGQAYYDGDTKAHTFGYATGGSNGPQAFLGPQTPMDTELIALLVDSIPGAASDLLVLAPRPGTGQLSYSPDASTPFKPVANGRSDLDGIGLVERSRTASNDRIEQLDGDGNLDRPIYRGPVQPFLCGSKECG